MEQVKLIVDKFTIFKTYIGKIHVLMLIINALHLLRDYSSISETEYILSNFLCSLLNCSLKKKKNTALKQNKVKKVKNCNIIIFTFLENDLLS